MSKSTRRDARICAVTVMFGADMHRDEAPEDVFEMTCSEGEISSNEFARGLFLGAWEHIDEIDDAIAKNAKGWKMERISKMSLSVMRIAGYELLFTDTPAPIVINEAIEIDKLYDGDDAPAFVNGVLNAIAKSRTEEK